MPLSPPTFTCHIRFRLGSQAISPFHAPTHGVLKMLPVWAPAGVNKWLLRSSGSEIQTRLSSKPAPQGRDTSLDTGQEVTTSPTAPGRTLAAIRSTSPASKALYKP